MGKGWRILGSGYSKNKCLLTVQHSWGSEQIHTSVKRRRTARSPASSAGACGAERTAPCVRLDWELLRARRQRAGSWQLSAACLLARSLAPPPTGKRAPTPSVIWHHLLFLMHGHNHSMGQNGFKKVGGILAIKKKKEEINRHWLIIQATLKPLEKLEEAAYSLGKGTTPRFSRTIL